MTLTPEQRELLRRRREAIGLEEQEAQRQAELAEQRTPLGRLAQYPSAVGQGVMGALGGTLQGAQVHADRRRRQLLGPMERTAEEGPLYRAGEALQGVFEVDEAYEGQPDIEVARAVGSLGTFVGIGVGTRRIPSIPTGLTRKASQRDRDIAAMDGRTIGDRVDVVIPGQAIAPTTMAALSGQAEAYQNMLDFKAQNPEQAAELGMDEEFMVDLAARGILPGVVQVMSLAAILRRIPEPMRPNATYYMLRRMAEAGVTEYTVENAAAVLQNDLRRTYDPDHPLWKDVPERGEPAGIAAALIQAVPFVARGRRAAPRREPGRGAFDEGGDQTPLLEGPTQETDAPEPEAGPQPDAGFDDLVDVDAIRGAEGMTEVELQQAINAGRLRRTDDGWELTPTPAESALARAMEQRGATREEPEVRDDLDPYAANTEPTEAQKEAGNYQLGRAKYAGLPIAVENPAGSVRRGTSPDGTEWSNRMPAHYGYVNRTDAADGDHIDVFLNPEVGAYVAPEDATAPVFVINQRNAAGGFDEHKVMLGYQTEEAAREAYLSAYDEGWTGLGSIVEMTQEQASRWMRSGNTKTELTPEAARSYLAQPEGTGERGIRLNPQDADSAQMFNEAAMRSLTQQSPKSRDFPIAMPIDDFLQLAKTGGRSRKMEGVNRLLDEDRPFSSIPHLRFEIDEAGLAVVSGHEGRHRAMALRERGYTHIPVILQSLSMRWRDMDQKQGLPKQLKSEDWKKTFAFPVTEQQLRQRFPEGGRQQRREAEKATRTPAFRRWFGDSQVVDENGNPLVVYHRTSAEFDAFRVDEDGPSGAGIYFGADPNRLPQAHNRKAAGDNIIPAYLSIKTPLMLDEFNLQEMQQRWANGSKEFPFYMAPGAATKLQDAGFDGVFVEDVYGDGSPTEYVAFSPQQVKSAVGNVGTFDPADPSIIREEGTQYGQRRDPEAVPATGAQQLRDGRRVQRGDRGAQAPTARPAETEGRPADIREADERRLKNLPRFQLVDGKMRHFGPFLPAHRAAEAYAEAAGVDYRTNTEYAAVDRERAQRIAQEYEAMQHAPNDPEVRAAYEAMAAETIAQYEAIMETGLTVEFITAETGDPYASNPRKAILDVVENNHLWVFSTEDGYGQEGITAQGRAENPMLAETGIEISGRPALVNDLFRVVHDYFGHIKDGVGFRWTGEENAWRSHSTMYTPLARRAMTSETRGQNSWVNFGPHGAKNRTASGADTIYAPQKIGLMPVWVSEDGAYDEAAQAGERLGVREEGEGEYREGGGLSGRFDVPASLGAADRIAPEHVPTFRERAGGQHAIAVVGVHYGYRENLTALDPAKYGTGTRGAEARRIMGHPVLARRIYFYEQTERGNLPASESVVSGQNVYRVKLANIYDATADPEGISAFITQRDGQWRMTEFELAVLERGYDGLRVDGGRMGHSANFIAIFPSAEVQVQPLGSRVDAKAELEAEAQIQPYRVEERGPKREINQYDLLRIREDGPARIALRRNTPAKAIKGGQKAMMEIRKRLFGLREASVPVTIEGLELYMDLAKGRPAKIIGHTVNTPGDLALAAQIYRDPRFETFRIMYMKGNKVVAQDDMSIRHPGAVQFVPTLPDDIRRRMRQTGADGYYMLHNHPSQNSNPSASDERTTRALADKAPGMRAHVIINHKEYTVITAPPGGSTVTVQTINDDTLGTVDFYREGEVVPHPIVGAKIDNPAQLARVAPELNPDPSRAMLIQTNTRGRIVAIMQVNPEVFTDTRDESFMLAALRRARRELGAGGYMFAIAPEGNTEIFAKLRVAYQKGVIMDGVMLTKSMGAYALSSEPGGPRRYLEIFKMHGAPIRDEPDPYYPMQQRNLQRELRERMGAVNGPPVSVAQAYRDLPPDIRKWAREANGGVDPKDLKGIYDYRPGQFRIWVVADNHATVEDALETAAHEMVGHYGMRALLGSEYNDTMDRVWRSFPAGVRQAGTRNFGSEYDHSNLDMRRVAAEEYMAYIAGRVSAEAGVLPKQRTLLARLIEMIRAALRRLGIKAKRITEAEILDLITKAHNFVRSPSAAAQQQMYGTNASRPAPTYYSQAAQLLASSKTAENASPADYANYIRAKVKAGEVKKAEIEWNGILQTLEGMQSLSAIFMAAAQGHYGYKTLTLIHQNGRNLSAEQHEVLEKYDGVLYGYLRGNVDAETLNEALPEIDAAPWPKGKMRISKELLLNIFDKGTPKIYTTDPETPGSEYEGGPDFDGYPDGVEAADPDVVANYVNENMEESELDRRVTELIEDVIGGELEFIRESEGTRPEPGSERYEELWQRLDDELRPEAEARYIAELEETAEGLYERSYWSSEGYTVYQEGDEGWFTLMGPDGHIGDYQTLRQANEAATEDATENMRVGPPWSEYTIPEANVENYRVMLVKYDSPHGYFSFGKMDSHFGEDDSFLVHMRYYSYGSDQSVIVLDELQSDLHQHFRDEAKEIEKTRDVNVSLQMMHEAIETVAEQLRKVRSTDFSVMGLFRHGSNVSYQSFLRPVITRTWVSDYRTSVRSELISRGYGDLKILSKDQYELFDMTIKAELEAKLEDIAAVYDGGTIQGDKDSQMEILNRVADYLTGARTGFSLEGATENALFQIGALINIVTGRVTEAARGGDWQTIPGFIATESFHHAAGRDTLLPKEAIDWALENMTLAAALVPHHYEGAAYSTTGPGVHQFDWLGADYNAIETAESAAAEKTAKAAMIKFMDGLIERVPEAAAARNRAIESELKGYSFGVPSEGSSIQEINGMLNSRFSLFEIVMMKKVADLYNDQGRPTWETGAPSSLTMSRHNLLYEFQRKISKEVHDAAEVYRNGISERMAAADYVKRRRELLTEAAKYPFANSYHELAFKGLLEKAVSTGAQEILIVPGQVHGRRYGASSITSALTYYRYSMEDLGSVSTMLDTAGTPYSSQVSASDAARVKRFYMLEEQNSPRALLVPEDRLSSWVGQHAASRILAEDLDSGRLNTEYTPEDIGDAGSAGMVIDKGDMLEYHPILFPASFTEQSLKIHSGQIAVYNDVMINNLNKFLKKYGAKIQPAYVPWPTEWRHVNSAMFPKWFKLDENGAVIEKGIIINRLEIGRQLERAVRDTGFPLFARAAKESEGAAITNGQSSFDIDEGNNFDKMWRYLVYNVQNSFEGLFRVQAAIEEATGSPIPEQLNAVLHETAYHGKVKERADYIKRKFMLPLVKAVKESGFSWDEAELYLYARHAKERNEQIRKIDPNNDAGSGMTDEEATQILDHFRTVTKNADPFRKVHEIVKRLVDFDRRNRVAYGLETAETVEGWDAMYDNYVPLQGWAEDPTGDMEFVRSTKQLGITSRGSKGGFSAGGPSFMRALGRKSRAANILSTLVAQAQATVMRGEKAAVGQSMIRMIEAYPKPDFWKLDWAPTKKYLNPKTGLVSSMRDPNFRAQDNVVIVRQDGRDRMVVFNRNNPTAMRIANAMNNTSAANINKLQAVGLSLVRYMSAINTGFNPEFAVTNLFRDYETALINLSREELMHVQAKVARDAIPAIKGILQELMGRPSKDNVWGRRFRDFEKAGARIGWVENWRDIEALANRLRSELEESPGQMTKRAVANVFDFVEKANAAVENGVRLAAYHHLREAGMSELKAGEVARNLTVNFNRKGAATTNFHTFYVFFNASVQGINVLWQAAKNRRVQKVLAGLVAFGAIMDIAMRMLGGEDEDGEWIYDRIPEGMKQRNMVIMIPKHMQPKGEDGGPPPLEKTYLTIPLPYGYNLFHNIGRKLGGYVSHHLMGQKRNVSPFQDAMDLTVTFLESFNPLGTEDNLFATLLPTAARPIYQLSQNRAWHGGPISKPVDPYDPTPLPRSEDYWERATPSSVYLAKLLNRLSGGTTVTPGAWDVAPEQIDYLISFFGGGAADFVQQTTFRLPQSVIDPNVDFTTSQVPFARRIVRRTGEPQIRQQFFDLGTRIDYAVREVDVAIENGQMDRTEVLSRRFEAELAAQGALKQTRDVVRRLNREITITRADEQLAKVDRDRTIRELRTEQAREMFEFLRVYNETIDELRKAEEPPQPVTDIAPLIEGLPLNEAIERLKLHDLTETASLVSQLPDKPSKALKKALEEAMA